MAQWYNVGLWPASFHYPALNLQLTGGQTVSYRSDNQANSAFHPFEVNK